MHSQAPTVTILVALATLAACGDRGGAEGPWEFKVDSSAGARPAASLRSVGQEGPRGEPQKTSVVLSLDCRADHTGATILTPQSLRQGEDGAGSSKTTAVFPVAGLEARRAEFIAACDRSGGDRKRPPR